MRVREQEFNAANKYYSGCLIATSWLECLHFSLVPSPLYPFEFSWWENNKNVKNGKDRMTKAITEMGR